MSEDEIPAWALARAHEVMSVNALALSILGTLDQGFVGGMANSVARYVMQNEQPPVDPLLVRARQILADEFSSANSRNCASDALAGKFDNNPSIKAIIRALKDEKPYVDLDDLVVQVARQTASQFMRNFAYPEPHINDVSQGLKDSQLYVRIGLSAINTFREKQRG